LYLIIIKIFGRRFKSYDLLKILITALALLLIGEPGSLERCQRCRIVTEMLFEDKGKMGKVLKSYIQVNV
jgi:hypothetical protein